MLHPSSNRVALRHLRKTSGLRDMWDALMKGPEPEVPFAEKYENEIKVTELFFKEMGKIVKGDDVRDLKYLVEDWYSNRKWTEPPKRLITKITREMKALSVRYLRGFNKEVLDELRNTRMLGGLPSHIIHYRDRVEEWAKKSQDGRRPGDVGIFLDTLSNIPKKIG